MKSRLLTGILTVAIALGLGSTLAMGQEDQSQASEPASTVARVSLINGNVSTQRGDTGDWVATTINAPLVLGDHISTGNASRTEVQLDYADVMRLDQNSEAKIADLTRSRIQIQVAQGLMDFAVFKGGQADLEIDTPNVAILPTEPGTYRIQVNSQGETQVIVRDGQAQISTPQGSTTVKQGDLITVEGLENPQYRVTQAPAFDSWDNWNRDRDNVILNAQSYTHTDRYYTGSQDLDHNGRWVEVPGYDWCWTPYVNAGWVPYRYGRWVWEPGWGWTWVSYENWGWAPYHYGRWFYYGSSWYWWPGYVGPGYYPVWAPAYVSFIGFGWGHFSFGFGFNSIGWLPLGPRDHFRPWYGHGHSYNVVNVTNITNVTNINNYNGGSNFHGAMSNAHIRGAVTTVSTSDFTSGRMPRTVKSITVNQLRQGNVINGTLPVVPTRQSLSPVDRPAVVPAVAKTGAGQRTFFTRNKPPAGPQSFNAHAAQVQQMVNTRTTMPTATTANAGVRTGRVGQTSRPTEAAAGAAAANARTRSQASGSAPTATRTAPAQSNSGWRTFGESARPSTSQTAAPGREVNAGRTGQARPAQTAPRQSVEAARPGWSSFGGGQAPRATETPAAGGQAPRPTSRPEATRPQPQAAPSTSRSESASSGVKKSGTAPVSRPAPAATKSAPRSNAPATRAEPKSEPRSQAAPRNDNPSRSSNWRQFTPQAGPRSAPSQAEPARAGWSRFSQHNAAPRSERMNSPSRSERPAYREAPRSYGRSSLGIRKPIVVERSPRSYEGPSRGSWGSPSRGSYGNSSRGGSYSRSGGSYNRGGGGGSWGGNRGGGGGGGARSAPRGSSRGGGGDHRH
jgi:hypothetical protein